MGTRDEVYSVEANLIVGDLVSVELCHPEISLCHKGKVDCIHVQLPVNIARGAVMLFSNVLFEGGNGI